MDTSKQPGINILAILLIESYFKRLPEVKDLSNVKIDLQINNNIDQKNKQLTTEMKLKLNSESDSVYGYFTYVGVFAATDKNEQNMSLEQFAKNNAPGCLFPYMRETIQNVSLKAGINPIVLQPLNFLALETK